MEEKAAALGVRKGAWTAEEDILLRKCIDKYGEGKWHQIPYRAGLNRCRKSCRLRWLNYLRPDIKRGHFTRDEVDLIMRLHKLLGNRWSLIAGRLPRRTANDVKNFWNTHIDKKSSVVAPVAAKTHQNTKTITERNIVRPRPRNFIKAQAPNWLIEPILAKPNKPKNNDQNPKNNQSSPKSWIADPNVINPKNDHHHLQPSSSAQEQAEDNCIRWWKDLLETTERQLHPANHAESGELGTPFVFPVEHTNCEAILSSELGHDQDNGCVDQIRGLSSLYLDGELWSFPELG